MGGGGSGQGKAEGGEGRLMKGGSGRGETQTGDQELSVISGSQFVG